MCNLVLFLMREIDSYCTKANAGPQEFRIQVSVRRAEPHENSNEHNKLNSAAI